MDYEIELEHDQVIFTAADAPERSTGWKDSHSFDRLTGVVEFFDAEANEVFVVSPIGDLLDAIDDWQAERVAEVEAEADRAEFGRDPYAYHGVRRSDFV